MEGLFQRIMKAARSGDMPAVGYLLGWAVLGKLPLSVSRDACAFLADRASKNGTAPLEQLRMNLSRVVGPENVTKKLVRDSVRSYMRYWCEAFQLPRLSHDPTLAATLMSSVEGLEHLDASLARGKGVVLVLPHMGNWDMAGVALVALHGGFTTVAERLKPTVLYDAFVDYREELGFTVIAHDEKGAGNPYERCRKTLESGGIVCLLGERDLKSHGVEVDFFGEPARFPVGPAKMALETGAALHPVGCWFTDNGWGFSIGEELPFHRCAAGAAEDDCLKSAVQAVAHALATVIAAHPADWHMMQPVWTDDIARRKQAKRKRDDNPRQGESH